MEMECSDDSFYEELGSLMSSSDNYKLDDIEEILRSTDSHLDSSYDFSDLTSCNVHDFEIPFEVDLQNSAPQSAPTFYDEFNFDIPLPSTEVFNSETSSPAYETQRTSSVSSMDEDSFNPDEFINLLRNGDRNSINENELRDRNTPSPTESCSSSGGSSTSGVQSDVSSVVSRSQNYMEPNPQIDCDPTNNENMTATAQIKDEYCYTPGIATSTNGNVLTPITHIKEENLFTPVTVGSPLVEQPQQTVILPSTVTNTVGVSLPLIVPVLPVHTTVSTAPLSTGILQPLQQVQSISVLPGTLIPVKRMTQVANSVKTPTPIKIEPKLAPKTTSIVSSSTVNTAPTPMSNVTKIAPPTNAKPKTVFLTLNDYKALTQRNGTGGKISGGQSPKIILKTASGKVITANKIMSSGSGGLNLPPHFVPKVMKTSNGPLVIKQSAKGINSTVHAAGNTFAAAKPSSTSGSGSLSVYKGLFDEKIWKKQQRMIKNRESASMSRKKKKEYVVSLESRISDLEKKNCTLSVENSSLRSQLVALAQSCQCKNSNVSEFILNTLDLNTKVCGNEQHVRIAPKHIGKSLKQRMSAANLKKNLAILFAMAFMVSLNVGNFQTYMNKNSIENSIESAAASADEPVTTGRRLLWVESESEFKEKLNSTKREAEMDVPPLHFLQPVNRTRATVASEQNRNVTAKDKPLTSTADKCVGGSNYTENHRLHSNLHKWIDVNDYLNLSLHSEYGNALNNPLRFGKFDSEYYDRKPLHLHLQDRGPHNKIKRKLFLTPPLVESKQRKLDPVHEKKISTETESVDETNSVEVFKPKISEEYLRLFKGINRQDDTFYVISFNMDHILLPASAYNKSAPPKMSLLLPAGDPSVNGDIRLMQIDCEVVNTTELELKSFMIPEKLRPHKFGNFNSRRSTNGMVNNETRSREVYGDQRKEKVAMRSEMPKQKSPPNIYYIKGPRSAAAAAAMKSNSTLNGLNSNVSIESIATNGEKNSTLFTKIRETVESDEQFN